MFCTMKAKTIKEGPGVGEGRRSDELRTVEAFGVYKALAYRVVINYFLQETSA